jgi:hypothetical protein
VRRTELAHRAALLPVLLLSGCLYVSASGAFGSVLDPEVVARIVPGETTKSEVLALLGPPEEYLRSEVLESLGDEHTRVAGAVALGNRAQDAFTYKYDDFSGSGNVFLLYNRFSGRVESDLLVVFFDREDRVREIAFRSAGSKR